MKSIFDKAAREELINRVRSLHEANAALWGKMSVYQMVQHCRLWEAMIQDNQRHRRSLPGLIFGKLVLKSVLKDETPLRRNTPTIPDLIIKGNGDLEKEKKDWISRIDSYENYAANSYIHPFFGKMNKEQIGYLAYKHADHHLKQFGA